MNTENENSKVEITFVENFVPQRVTVKYDGYRKGGIYTYHPSDGYWYDKHNIRCHLQLGGILTVVAQKQGHYVGMLQSSSARKKSASVKKPSSKNFIPLF